MKDRAAQATILPKSKRRQANSNRQRKDGQERSTPISVIPLIVEYGLYSFEQVVASLATSPRSLEKIMADGMRSGKRHTQRRFFWGRDIIRYLVGEIDSIPDWQCSRRDAV